jgi:hypothetical protein
MADARARQQRETEQSKQRGRRCRAHLDAKLLGKGLAMAFEQTADEIPRRSSHILTFVFA